MSRRNAPRVRDYLSHILQAVENIREYTAGMDVTAISSIAARRMR
jgi:uncharacterized protein with HEPN domain